VGWFNSKCGFWEDGIICDGRKPAPQATTAASTTYEPNTEALAQVKEMIYRAATMRLGSIGSADSGDRAAQRAHLVWPAHGGGAAAPGAH